jgi:hypothetical protein
LSTWLFWSSICFFSRVSTPSTGSTSRFSRRSIWYPYPPPVCSATLAKMFPPSAVPLMKVPPIPRSVDADEPREALAGCCVRTGEHRDLGEQLGPQRPFALLDAPALLADLLTDLLARLLPQSRRPGRREGLHLQGGPGVIEPHRHDALGLLLNLETQIQTLTGKDLDAAQVDVGTNGIGLRFVERACFRSVAEGGCGRRFFRAVGGVV